MNDQLILFGTAKLAKEKGFDIETEKAYINYYSNEYNGDRRWLLKVYHSEVYYGTEDIFMVPSQSLLQKWLREKHNIIIEANYRQNVDGFYGNLCYRNDPYCWREFGSVEPFKTYEESLEVGLQNALELI